jgi:uncharacterized damage-inducible protein DinB
MDCPDETVRSYVAACDDLGAAVRGMTREQLCSRPQAGKWSTMEVLCHLVDTDLATAYRIRVALVSERPRLPGVAREQMTSVLVPDARDAAEELAVFQAIRSQTGRLVAATLPESLDRQILLLKSDGEEVVRTVKQLLTGITQHVHHHLAFVGEKRKSLSITD